MNTSISSLPLPVQIIVNGQFYTDPAEISIHLALHFFSPTGQSATQISTSSMSNSLYNRSDFPPISDFELADAIASLSPQLPLAPMVSRLNCSASRPNVLAHCSCPP
jgi:hypothetical protein